MTGATTTRTAQIIDRYEAHMIRNLGRQPIAFVRGQGARLWDAEGKPYLDLFAGFGAPILGHCHPDLVRAVTQQAQQLWHVGNLFHTEPQTLAAEAIGRHSHGYKVFFCHAGADANEAAIKLARLYGHHHPGKQGQRYKTISTTRSFHGRSFGTMGATGNPKVREGFGPLPPGFVNVAYNDIDAVRKEIDELSVAVIAEPIQGEGGIHMPDADYFAKLRQLCDDHDMILICDEVWTGCGRTGKSFGHQLWNVQPDAFTLGKGVGGGLAVGALCAKPELAELYDSKKQGIVRHATTLGGNCLAMAVTATIFQVIDRDHLLDHVTQMGRHVMRRVNDMKKALPMIKEVRGAGLFLGIELDPGVQGCWFKNGNEVVNKALEKGLLLNATHDVVLRIAPPLTVTQAELDEGLEIMAQCLKDGLCK